MYTTNDDWISLECGQCKYWKINADMEWEESICKRLDHKHLKFAKKIYKSYDCGQYDTHTCSDFEPKESEMWLKKHWEEIKRQIIPYKSDEVILLNIDKNTDVKYAVKATEFYDNTFINDDGTLRWIYKCYSVRSRKSVTGCMIIYEFPDGSKYLDKNRKREWKPN